MHWYWWLFLIVYVLGYPACAVAAFFDDTNDSDRLPYPLIAIAWPLFMVVAAIVLPIIWVQENFSKWRKGILQRRRDAREERRRRHEEAIRIVEGKDEEWNAMIATTETDDGDQTHEARTAVS